MKQLDLEKALASAVRAAGAAGVLMRKQLRNVKQASETTQHDIKLELDVRCQKLIEKSLRTAFPKVAVLGEEGITGDPEAEYRWVVDPIDGTVNFAYGIPHACVSIAMQRHTSRPKYPGETHESVLGVVYDPFCDEMFTGIRGRPARLNGRAIHVSKRTELKDCIVSIGFAKSRETIENTLPYFGKLAYRVRKIRMMGAAALGLAYVACGRFDAYIERGIRLWDVAAGGMLIECAGGEFWRKAADEPYGYRMVATNGRLRKKLQVPF